MRLQPPVVAYFFQPVRPSRPIPDHYPQLSQYVRALFASIAAAAAIHLLAACSQTWGPPPNPGVTNDSPVGGGYPFQWAPNRDDSPPLYPEHKR